MGIKSTDQVAEHEVIDTYLGKFCVPANTPRCQQTNKLKSGQNPAQQVMDYLDRFIRKGCTVIDIGASYGIVHIDLAQRLGKLGGGTIYSIDGNPLIYNLLTRNIALNAVDGVTSIALLNVCDEEGGKTVGFPEPDVQKGDMYNGYGAFGMEAGPGTGHFFPVRAITIDSLGLKNVAVLKVDIEGYELKALRGARQTIMDNGCAVIFEYSSYVKVKESFDEYKEFFSRLGYEIVEDVKNDYLAVPKKTWQNWGS